MLRDPAATFLLVGLVGGLVLTFTIKPFDGVDETAHFYRSYQVSGGRMLPIRTDDETFRGGGACVPRELALEVRTQQGDNLAEQLGVDVGAATTSDLAPCPEDRDDRDEVFVNFATFASPVPYLPQAVAISVSRGVGAGALGMLYAGRLAALAVYLAIVYVAIRRSPRARWVLCVVALLPTALFESAASLSHDVLNLAIVLLVVSSALRTIDPECRSGVRALVIEASILSGILALCKPTYALVSLCYLLPLLERDRRRELRVLIFPVAGALILSLLWNRAVVHLWASDAELFGIPTDEEAQKDALLHAPWDFLVACLRTTKETAGLWLRDLIGTNPRYVEWWRGAQLLALGAFIAVAIAPGGHDDRPLRVRQRALLVGIFLVGSLIVFAAYWVYWTAPSAEIIGGVQIRYFLPLVVVLAVGVMPRDAGRRIWRMLRVPPGLVLVAVEVAVVTTAVTSVV